MKGSRLFKAVSVMLSLMLVFSLFPTQALATGEEVGSTPAPTNLYTVTFLGSEGKVLKEEKVAEGMGATAPEIPELEGYVADGWDTDFSVVKSDLTVTAVYKVAEDFGLRSLAVVDSYSVTYVGLTNPAPTDSNLYASGAAVTVQSPTNRTAGGNKVFYYWMSSNGGTIMPGATFAITSNTTLTAKYDSGYGLSMQVKPNGAGTITKSPDYELYAPGTVVTVTGTPSSSAWALIGYFKNFGSFGAYDMLEGNQIVIQPSNTNKVFAVFDEAYIYTVKYYKDSISSGNLLGTDTGSGLEGTAIPYTDGKYLPTGYVTPGVVSGRTTISDHHTNTLNVVYSKGSFGYTVKYYRDGINVANLLGSDTGSGVFGSTIPYTNGKYLPTGYVTPGAVSGQTTITAVASNNVLNVVYSRGNFGYTVKYYKDSTAGTLLGTDTNTGAYGTSIPYTDGKYLPTGYVTPGALSGQLTITTVASNNVLKVVYSKGNFGYTVNYYQDSTAGTLLGSDTGSGLFGSTIPYTNGKYLSTGYVAPGAVSGQTTITATASNNVLNIVYSKGAYGFVVHYYQDSTAGTLLGSDTGSGTFASAIPYTDGKFLPTGYVIPGALSGQTTITAVASDNVLNVVYSKGTYGYTVNYYKDSVDGANLLGTDAGSGTFTEAIPYTDGKFLPTGYVTPGAVSGQTTITVVAADNVLNVIYSKGSFGFTVNYYQDSVDAANLLGTDSGSGTFTEAIPYTDGKFLPTGYVTPGAVSGQTTITEVAENNVLNVVYSKGTYGYTVNYYQDSVDGANLLGTDTGSGTFTDAILYIDGKFLPTGYVTPGNVSGQMTITEVAENNVLSVVYSKGTYGYTINYYQDSIEVANLLGSDTGSGTFTDAIPYNDGKYLPIGYVTPGTVTGQTTITAVADDNVLNVVYGPGTFAVSFLAGTTDPVSGIPAGNPAVVFKSTYAISNSAPTRAGYTFLGWSTSDVSGLSQTYLAGESFAMPAGDVTLTATWSAPIDYAINYVMNGGTNDLSNPTTYNITSATITLAAPTRLGYNFLGWSPSNTIASGSTGDKTFTARWSNAIRYNITYTMNGGNNSLLNPTRYTVNSPTITLRDPWRLGYDFAGWLPTNSIPNGSTGDKAFTATWTPVTYTIHYYMNGGTNAEANPATYTTETPTINLANPTRAGYDFWFWFPLNSIPQGSVGDRYVWAIWKAPTNYSITYNLNGGTNNPANPSVYNVESSAINLADPTRTGYTFAGWSPTGSIPSGSTGNKEFTASWTAIDYSITYDLAGGVNDAANPSSYTIETPTFSLNNPTREFYTFAGWTPSDTTIEQGSMGNLSFTASWTPIAYNITYALGGGVNPAANPATYTVETPTFTLAAPTRLGYAFTGWTPADATIELGSHGDLTYTANWTPIVYPITYVMNGGANPAANPATYTVESPAITLAAPTQAGYVFLGWTPAGVIPTGTTGALVFTANWSAPIVYNITYVLNGGTNGVGNPGTYTVESPTITLAAATREGYDFLGWTPTNNIPAGSVGDETFTATWSQPHVHTVTYFVTGGTATGLDGGTPYKVYTNVAYGSVVPVPNNPSQDQYTFDEWTTAIPVRMPDADVVIYGSMTRIPALQEIIAPEKTPLAGPTWSLLNLILTVLTVISIGTILSIFQKKRENKSSKKNTAFSLSTLLPAAGVIVAFIMTQVLSGSMVFTDRWSYLFAGIALVQAAVVTLALTGKTKKA